MACMGCHAGVADFGALTTDGSKNGPPEWNGARRGNLHGGTFVWPAFAKAGSAGTTARRFIVGGWMSGWTNRATDASCAGGECSHNTSGGQGYNIP
jgi:hypothetical protein